MTKETKYYFFEQVLVSLHVRRAFAVMSSTHPSAPSAPSDPSAPSAPPPGDHITPAVWGPSTWRAIHFIALSYPEHPTENSIQSYGDFFVEALPKVIPCKTCADNYVRHLQELPITPYLYSGGKHRLFEWSVALHNLVNKELGKTDPAWTPERALAALVSPSPSSNVAPATIGAAVPAMLPQPQRIGLSTANVLIGSFLVLLLIVIAALLIRKYSPAK